MKDVDSCVESLSQPDTPNELTLLQFPESVDRRLSAAGQRSHCFLHRKLAVYAAGIVLSVHCKRFSVFFQYQREQQFCRFGEILRTRPVVEASGDQINVWFVVVHGATSFQYFRAIKKDVCKNKRLLFTLPCIDRNGISTYIPMIRKKMKDYLSVFLPFHI